MKRFINITVRVFIELGRNIFMILLLGLETDIDVQSRFRFK